MLCAKGPADMGCFLAEWYRSEFSDPATTKFIAALQFCASEPSGVESLARLRVVFSVPAADAVYALFECDSAEDVLRVCTRAGGLPRRLTPDGAVRIMALARPTGC